VRAKRFNAAAEAAVGLALIIAIYRHDKTTHVDEVDSMKGQPALERTTAREYTFAA
jgi:hypothetical protein